MNADALAIFEGLDDEMTGRQRAALGTDQSAVLARVWENTAKVALIKAVSADPAEPIIRGVDAQWAREVVEHCVATMIVQADRHIAENEVERNKKRILEHIRKYIRDLIEAEQIVSFQRSTAGRASTWFRLAELTPN
jgi:hypothetical protein